MSGFLSRFSLGEEVFFLGKRYCVVGITPPSRISSEFSYDIREFCPTKNRFIAETVFYAPSSQLLKYQMDEQGKKAVKEIMGFINQKKPVLVVDKRSE